MSEDDNSIKVSVRIRPMNDREKNEENQKEGFEYTDNSILEKVKILTSSYFSTGTLIPTLPNSGLTNTTHYVFFTLDYI